MGCLTGDIAYLGGLKSEIKRIGGIVADVVKSSGIACDMSVIGRLTATAERRGSLQARCGIICEVNGAAYLRVEPEVIWLMPSNFNYGEVDVYANVEWIAK